MCHPAGASEASECRDIASRAQSLTMSTGQDVPTCPPGLRDDNRPGRPAIATIRHARFCRSIPPSLQRPFVAGAVEEHGELPGEALAAPVIAPVAVVPPVARQPLGTEGACDGDPVAAPGDDARPVAIAHDLDGLRWIERAAGGGHV